MADVLECFGRVLAADVEEDFLTTGVLVYEACGAGEWLVGFGGSLSCGEIVKDVLFFWVGGGSDGKRRRRTGAVVDLVVDDHVEIFL